MTQAFIAVGSNILPEKNVPAAVRRLGQFEKIVALSTVYRSPAEGRPEQPPYHNCVAQIETVRPPLDLRRVLRRIEEELGRERSADKFAARTIDLDLIWYDDLVLRTAEMTLPDPQITERPFLAVPLSELAPDLVLPGSGLTVRAAAAKLSRESLTPLPDSTEFLRKELVHEL